MLRRFLRGGVANNPEDCGEQRNVGARTISTAFEAESSNATGASTAFSSRSRTSLLESMTGKVHRPPSPSTSWKAHEKLKDVVANTMKVEELINFDACIEAADSLASTSTSSGRMDHSTGLVDCSVLVSANGELLIIPQLQLTNRQQQQQKSNRKASSTSDPHTTRNSPSLTNTNATKTTAATRRRENGEESFQRTAKAFWETARENELGDDYNSAIFLGHDLHHNGDKILNGFTAKGWSMAAASLALKQSTDAMETLTDCVDTLVQTKQAVATMEQKVVEKLRVVVIEAPELGETRVKQYQNFLQNNFPDERRLEISSTRVGPLSSSGATIQVAMVALQNYYSTVTELDWELWSSMSHPNGALTRLQNFKAVTEERVKNRQIALQEMIRRSKAMEKELISCKDEAKRKWDEVHAAEIRVTLLVEEKRMERNRMREKQRLEQIRQDVTPQSTSNASASEIWDIVSAVTAEMDEGSFAPMDIPRLSMERSPSGDAELKQNEHGGEESEEIDISSPSSIASRLELEEMRYELEEECGLPQLRRAALSAEEAVENVANSLLSIVSNLDTTSRSARLAAETCLVSSGNDQAECLRSIVQLERASINERLKQLEELENAVREIDIRADMNQYISLDKIRPGGQSFLGDDDDGGVASALAVLNDHTDGDTAAEPNGTRAGSLSERGIEEDDDNSDESSITPEYLEESVNEFFQKNPLLLATAPKNEKTKNAQKAFDTTVARLCTVGRDKSSKSRSRRSTICYTINAKRDSHSVIPSKLQFDGLCRVFSAALSGCTTDSRGISNAKLLMNLSQHFYFQGERGNKDRNDAELYIKNRISKHPIWEQDEFWDHALNQAIGESLTHSGVMTNFERASSKLVTSTSKKRSEWTQTHKTRWHDLKIEERYEAASQVHAVVFAQLGAMSHTMIDFGCSLERTSSFVRRMSIRNRLPMSQRTALLRHLIRNDNASTVPFATEGSSAIRSARGPLSSKQG